MLYLNIRSKLKEDAKVKEKDVQEAFFNFILNLSSSNLSSIQMRLIRDCGTESDISLDEYVKVR